jgi:hypothetical protein
MTHLLSIIEGAASAAAIVILTWVFAFGKKFQQWNAQGELLKKMQNVQEKMLARMLSKDDCAKCNNDIGDRIEIHYRQAEDRIKEVKGAALSTAAALEKLTAAQNQVLKDKLDGNHDFLVVVAGKVDKLVENFAAVAAAVKEHHDAAKRGR